VNGEPISPVPGLGLEGYADELVVSGGDTIRLMLSGPDVEAEVDVVRLRHGDPNPEGPGLREEASSWDVAPRVAVARQMLDLGSYVEVPDSPVLSPSGSFTLGLWFFPTLISPGWQTLAAKWAPGDLSYALYLGGNNFLTAAISRDGVTADWCPAYDFVARERWQYVALTFDAESGECCVWQWFQDASEAPLPCRKTLFRSPVHRGNAPLLIGASASLDDPALPHWAHFNGKIASPVLLDAKLDSDEVRALIDGVEPNTLAPVLGAWDLSLDVGTDRIADTSGHGNDGTAVNAPARAVPGPRWTARDGALYTSTPARYDAIHLHDDDLDDARWKQSVTIPVPADAKPGIYAARVRAGHDRLCLPFVVRGSVPRRRLAFLIPTLTWQAYSSNRTAWSFTEDGVLDRGLCIYDLHRDGSKVYYASWRRPTRSGNPSTGMRQWGAHTLAADLYLVDWLEEKGLSYDVFVDHDLHREGRDLLDHYDCVILGSHPEYATELMLSALREYLTSGGRIACLGGNLMHWVTSIDPARPFLMEVRKGAAEQPTVGPALIPARYFGGTIDQRSVHGEAQHSTTLETGGLWLKRGLPPKSIFGVEPTSCVFVPAEGRWGFRRLPASREQRFAWVFDGVGDEVIGNFGLNLGSAAGYEMDAVDEWAGEDASRRPIPLAEARHELISAIRDEGAPVAHIAFLEYPAGGAVFTVGSVTWTGSLAHNNYDNNVSRITENVLRRFLARPRGERVLD
jgi:N,N-dimethylformamidase